MSWPKVRLGELGKMIRGSGIRRNETVPEGLPCIRYGEIYTSYNVVLDRPRSFVPPSLYEKCPRIKKGDLVLALTGENKEEIAKSLAYLGDEEVAAGGDTAVWTGHGCDPLYLAYMMYSPRMIKAKADASNGHIVVHASVKKLQQIEVSLPPLSEQRKIAASVGRAMKRVDAIERQFEKLRETAAACFKSVLKATFDSIAWDVRLSDQCEVITDGDHLPPPKTSSGIPFLVISDVADGRLSFENTRFVPREYFDKIQASRKPRSGDVLLTVTGSYGIPVEVDVDREFCFQRHIALVRSTKFLPRFLVYMFLSPLSKRYFERVATGAAQKTVSLSNLRSMNVCCPSVAEQRRLVAHLDAAKARCDGIAALAARGLANCARMRKAILAEAFK